VCVKSNASAPAELFWAESKTPFSRLQVNDSSRVSVLREHLENEGILPTGKQIVFLINEEPLSKTQERFCGMNVFQLKGGAFQIYLQIGVSSTSISPNNTSRDLNPLQSMFIRITRTASRIAVVQLFEEFDLLNTDKVDSRINMPQLKDYWTRSSISAKEKFDMIQVLDAMEYLTCEEIYRCIPLPVRQSMSGRNSRNDDDDITKRLLGRLADIHHNGFEKIVRYSDLESHIDSVDKKQAYYSPQIRLSGRVKNHHKKLDKCSFAVEIDLPDYLIGKNAKPSVAFQQLCDQLNRIDAGDRYLEVSIGGLRSALKKFMVQGEYDVMALLNEAVPRSATEKADQLESSVSKIRNWSFSTSFGGIQLKQVFQKVDPSRKGFILTSDFVRCIWELCKIKMSFQDIDSLVCSFKTGNSISYIEFLAFIERGHEKWDDASKLKERLVSCIRDEFFNDKTGVVDFQKAYQFLNTKSLQRFTIEDFASRISHLVDTSHWKDLGNLDIHKSVNTPIFLRMFQDISGFNVRSHIDTNILTKFLSTNQPCHRTRFCNAVKKIWCEEDLDFIQIYNALSDKNNNNMTASSLKSGSESLLDIHFRNEEVFSIVKCIHEPRGFHDFMDFMFPSLCPNATDTAVRIRSAIKRKSLGGVFIKNVFNKFDRAGNHLLSVSAFQKGLAELDLGISNKDFEQFLSSGLLKLDSIGRTISYDEFVRFALQPAACPSAWRCRKEDVQMERSSDTLNYKPSQTLKPSPQVDRYLNRHRYF